MKVLIYFIPILLSCHLGFGFGPSPLFHHRNADNFDGNKASQTGRTGQSPESQSKTDPASCQLHFPKSGMCAELVWDEIPHHVGTYSFVLKFWDDSTAENAGYRNPPHSVFVKLWMPSMGHGSARVFVDPSHDPEGKDIPGIYTGSNVFFSMDKDWDVYVQLRSGSTVIEEAVVRVDI